METFPYTPSSPSEWDVETIPRLKSANFGGGYEQLSPDGLNHQLDKWTLKLKAMPEEIALQVKAFILATNGVAPFYFETPFSTTIKVRCKSGVKLTPEPGTTLINVSNLTFEQIP